MLVKLVSFNWNDTTSYVERTCLEIMVLLYKKHKLKSVIAILLHSMNAKKNKIK